MAGAMTAADSHLASHGSASWRDFFELGKPKVVALIVFTAVVGMFLAVPGLPPWQALFYGTLGIGLAASSAAATTRCGSGSSARSTCRHRSTGTTSPR